MENLRKAVQTAAGSERGIHVIYGEDDFQPLNLKFERVGCTAVSREDREGAGASVGDGTDFYRGVFRNWNGERLQRTGQALAKSARLLSTTELTTALERAIGRTFVAKIYPGMRGEALIALIDAGLKYFVLEIYDTGTANLRETPFSLRSGLAYGRERGIQFYCTSQQEGVVDFSEYVTGHQLWREGAIPMGSLTTESAWTRLIAAQLEAEATGGDSGDDEETMVMRLMDNAE